MDQSSINKSVTNTSANIVEHENTVIHKENDSSNIINPITGFVSESSQELTIEQPTWDDITYENCLRTYIGWKLDFITPKQMAKAGLYYLGKHDHVKCSICSTIFDNWKCGDDPIEEHKHRAPKCLFFNENHGNFQYYNLLL